MPNSFVADGLSQLSGAFIAGLANGGVLINTIYRDAESAFVVGRGDTVVIREPYKVNATQFTGTTVISDVTEGKWTIPIDRNPYSQTLVSQREKTLVIEDLVKEVITPQVQGVVEFIDQDIAAMLATTTGSAVGTIADGWVSGIAAARTELSANNVPAGDRFFVAAPDVIADLLASQMVVTGNYGQAETALGEGTIGRILGFTVVESNAIPAGTAYAYPRLGLAGIFRLPVAPEGGVAVGSSAWNGFSAQVLYGFDNSKLSDILTVQCLYGLGHSDVTYGERVLAVTLA